MSRIAANRTGSNVWLRPDSVYVVEIVSRSGREKSIDEFPTAIAAHDWAMAHKASASFIRMHKYTYAKTDQVWPSPARTIDPDHVCPDCGEKGHVGDDCWRW